MNHTNSSTSLLSCSTDTDEYCRITIDSHTNSYRIDSPVKPGTSNDKQTRSTTHSLLAAPYVDGK